MVISLFCCCMRFESGNYAGNQRNNRYQGKENEGCVLQKDFRNEFFNISENCDRISPCLLCSKLGKLLLSSYRCIDILVLCILEYILKEQLLCHCRYENDQSAGMTRHGRCQTYLLLGMCDLDA